MAGPVSDDGEAGMVPRKRSGRGGNRHDHPNGPARAATTTRQTPASYPAAIRKDFADPWAVARGRHIWPDVRFSCAYGGWLWPGMAKCLPSLAPRLAPCETG